MYPTRKVVIGDKVTMKSDYVKNLVTDKEIKFKYYISFIHDDGRVDISSEHKSVEIKGLYIHKDVIMDLDYERPKHEIYTVTQNSI